MRQFFTWIENNWIKKRTIYFLDLSDYREPEEKNKSVVNFKDSKHLYKALLKENIEPAWERRLKNNCEVWGIVKDGKFIGFSWTLLFRKYEIWHDSVPIAPNEVRIFNDWTDPNFRRQGLYNAIKLKQLADLKKNGVKYLTSVIEDSNSPAINGSKKLGFKPFKKNLLIKFKSRNQFSIIGYKPHYLSGVKKNKL